MNASEKKILSHFPSGLDDIVNKEFGDDVKCNSGFSIIEMAYVTNFVAKGAKRKQINLFIRGFMQGNEELGARLKNEATA